MITVDDSHDSWYICTFTGCGPPPSNSDHQNCYIITYLVSDSDSYKSPFVILLGGGRHHCISIYIYIFMRLYKLIYHIFQCLWHICIHTFRKHRLIGWFVRFTQWFVNPKYQTPIADPGSNYRKLTNGAPIPWICVYIKCRSMSSETVNIDVQTYITTVCTYIYIYW